MTTTERIEDLRRNVRECLDTDRERAKSPLWLLADEMETAKGAEFVHVSRIRLDDDLPYNAAFLLGSISLFAFVSGGVKDITSRRNRLISQAFSPTPPPPETPLPLTKETYESSPRDVDGR